jgi:hypothetical protein
MLYRVLICGGILLVTFLTAFLVSNSSEGSETPSASTETADQPSFSNLGK